MPVTFLLQSFKTLMSFNILLPSTHNLKHKWSFMALNLFLIRLSFTMNVIIYISSIQCYNIATIILTVNDYVIRKLIIISLVLQRFVAVKVHEEPHVNSNDGENDAGQCHCSELVNELYANEDNCSHYYQ